MSPTSWSSDSPTTAPRAVSRHHGARAPPNQGSTITPARSGRARGGPPHEGVGVEPARSASHATRDPAAERPPSSSHPPERPRVAIMASGTAADGAAGTGIETLAVVPHDTIGHASEEPVPRTSQARSPAPITTGMPPRSPSSAAGPSSRPPTVVGRRPGRGEQLRHGVGEPRYEGAESVGRATATATRHADISNRPVADAKVWSVHTSPVSRHATRSLGARSQRGRPSRARLVDPEPRQSWPPRSRRRAPRRYDTARRGAVVPERRRQLQRLGAGAPVRPQQRRSQRRPVRGHRHEGLAGRREAERVDGAEDGVSLRVERERRPAPQAATIEGHHAVGSCSARLPGP